VEFLERGQYGTARLIDRGRKFRALTLLLGGAFAAYCIATVAGAPKGLLSSSYNAFVAPVPIVVWWAYVRAPAELRRLVFTLGWASTFWLVGSVVWYGYYVAGGNTVPSPPGTWDVFFVLARVLVIVAILDTMRSVISFRIAALDAAVISAAAFALGTAFVWRGMAHGATTASLVTLNRPLLGVVTLALIASAAVGSAGGLRKSLALMALGEVAITIGSLIYSFQAIDGAFVDDRWANLGWAGGAALSTLAAFVLILGVDRPLAIVRRRIPDHVPAAGPVVLLGLAGFVLCIAVATYGAVEQSGLLIATGLISSAVIGIAMAVRARDSIRTAETAYERLDGELAGSERLRDELAAANRGLARANLEMQTLQVAMADLLNLADERAGGRIRELVEDTGGELAELLEQELDRTRDGR
jgi:hypothetical protein